MIDLLAGLRRERHPMHSPDAAREILALLPASDMTRTLGELTRWLRSVGESPDFKPQARQEVVGLLDQAGRLPEDRTGCASAGGWGSPPQLCIPRAATGRACQDPRR